MQRLPSINLASLRFFLRSFVYTVHPSFAFLLSFLAFLLPGCIEARGPKQLPSFLPRLPPSFFLFVRGVCRSHSGRSSLLPHCAAIPLPTTLPTTTPRAEPPKLPLPRLPPPIATSSFLPSFDTPRSPRTEPSHSFPPQLAAVCCSLPSRSPSRSLFSLRLP